MPEEGARGGDWKGRDVEDGTMDFNGADKRGEERSKVSHNGVRFKKLWTGNSPPVSRVARTSHKRARVVASLS